MSLTDILLGNGPHNVGRYRYAYADGKISGRDVTIHAYVVARGYSKIYVHSPNVEVVMQDDTVEVIQSDFEEDTKCV